MIVKSSVITWKLKPGTYSAKTCTFDAESVLNVALSESDASLPQMTAPTPTTVNVHIPSEVAKQSVDPATLKISERTNSTTVNETVQQNTDIQSVS
ncbi:MAG: hypothetical protein ACI4M9_05020, partial [Succinivibrio sp.]